jgi:hypothetical protein
MTPPKLLENERREIDFSPLYLASAATLSMSLSVAALVLFCRIQLEISNAPIIVTLFLLAGAFILLPMLLYSSARLTQNLVASLPVVAVITLGILVCASGKLFIAQIAIYPVLLGIWFAGIRTLAKASIAPRQYLAAIVMGLLLGALYFFIINTSQYANVFTPEAAILDFSHIDTLFHSSIAALFSRYGVISTGLDGLTPINYHALSHLLFGRIALWLDVSTIHIYAFASQIIGAPLLIFSMTFAVFALWAPINSAKAPLALLIFPLMFISLIEIKDWHSYLVSESYLFALGLFLLAIPLLLRLSHLHRVLESPTCLLSAVFTTVVVAGTKVSVGFILAVAVSASIFMQMLPRKVFLYLVGIGVLSAICLLLWVLLSDNSPNGLFKFGLFLKTHPLAAYLNMGVTALGIGALGFCAAVDIRHRRIAEILALAALASFIPTIILNVQGGSQYYFINVGVWIASVTICGLLVLPFVMRMEYAAKATIIAGAIFIVATIVPSQKRHSVKSFFWSAAKIEESAYKFSHPGSQPSISGHEITLTTIPTIIAKLHEVPNNISKTYIERLRHTIEKHLSPGHGRVALFIPPTATEFWKLRKDCRASVFLFPALLGIPMINGVPTDCPETDYSFHAYSDEAKNREMQDDELCRRAKSKGIDRIIKITSADEAKNLDCTSGK